MEYHRHSEEAPLSGLRSVRDVDSYPTSRCSQLEHALRHYPMQPLLRWTYRLHLWWRHRCGSRESV